MTLDLNEHPMNADFYYVYVNKVFTEPIQFVLQTNDKEEARTKYKKSNMFWSTGIIHVRNGIVKTHWFYGNNYFEELMKQAASELYFSEFERFLQEDLMYQYLDCLALWVSEEFQVDENFEFPGACTTFSDVLFAANLGAIRLHYHDIKSWNLIYDINLVIKSDNALDVLHNNGFNDDMIGVIEGGIHFPQRSDFSTGEYFELFFKEVSMLPAAGIAALSSEPSHTTEGECLQIPVLLIHGCDSNSRQWLIMVKTLKDAGLSHIYTVDLDDTRFQTKSTIETYTNTVLEKINEIEDETFVHNVILVGHSMGGLISVNFAYEHPDRVRAVVTMSSPLVGSTMVSLAQNLGVPTHSALTQMNYGSDFMRDFGRKAVELENSGSVLLYSAYSIIDEMVQPSVSITRDPQRTLILNKSGHFSILFSSKFNNWLKEVILNCQDEEYMRAPESSEETVSL